VFGKTIPYAALLDRQKAIALAHSKTARDFLTLGQLNDDDYNSGALLNFDKALKCNPKSAIAWANRAKALWSYGDNARSLESCNRAIELDKHIDCYYQRALLRPDLTGAIADMQFDYASNKEAWVKDNIRLARLDRMKKLSHDLNGAIQEISKTLAFEPTVNNFGQRAGLLIKQNRYEEALKDLDEMVRIDHSRSSLVCRAALRIRIGDICGGLQDLWKANFG
jgi:tetratricopeptide (TPR) repeat protein